ncbi:beta-glucosidase [Halolactibacillus halophilus]|uniref:beta-glucosidase n=1 Tax=Halolactibacillus halophilus TaxID=306540 RepID=A0A1I5M5I1_9BACI|nr:beta-glucosidase BglX [Halolactibacillus halophilus]GEM01024.1 beta-glucosidase [Halolactibacillus halophilus]SFP04898.1 beta-glucosidase [Halolactibacillus halophilus]
MDIDALLKQMTLDEKIDQLMQLAAFLFDGASHEGEITGPLSDLGISSQTIHNSGSVLGGSGAAEIKRIQEAHLTTNRLNIPLLIMADIIHGYKTIFPHNLALSCSFDPELVEETARIAAKEAAVSGIHVTFAPMVDLVRDPRWGRVMESTGEDPYLNSELARAFVRGFQGQDIQTSKDSVAACVKHFAAYGAIEAGRDYNTVNMSERELREVYLPGYKAALDENAQMVMTAFNTIDGKPCSGNKALMRNLLRDEWGFNGVVISDWGSIRELIPHGVAENEKEAAALAIEAGVDIEMMTSTYVSHLKELIKEGTIEESRIDESVRRILKLKQTLGLFENPYRFLDEDKAKDVIFSEEHRLVARRAAEESIVLLENDGILPINKGDDVGLIGPFAESQDLLGPWSWIGDKNDVETLAMGIKKVFSKPISISSIQSVHAIEQEELVSAIEVAKKVDTVILALGESSDMSGEGGSRSKIDLPEIQLELLKKIHEVNNNIVVVLINGRPLDLTHVTPFAKAIVEAWFPGSSGGTAIARILSGDKNPSAKLTMSFPDTVGQIPVYYNHHNTGRPLDHNNPHNRYVSKFIDGPNMPRYPFGYGLSYSSFEYSELELSQSVLRDSKTLYVSVKVKNTKERSGDEIVQLYTRDHVGEVVRPLKELKAFKKIHLESEESKTVTFAVTEEMLRYTHSDLTCYTDPGEFTVFVGTSSANTIEASFKYQIESEEK